MLILRLVGSLKVRGLTHRALNAAVIIASAVAFGWVALGALPSIDTLGDMRWPPLLGAITLQFLMAFFLMLVWVRLLGVLWTPDTSDKQPSRSSLYTAYSRSWLARYIPGRIWSLGGRALMARKLGVPVGVVARSMTIEVIFTYGLVTIIGGTLLLTSGFNILVAGALLLLGLVVFIASLLILQKVLNKCLPSIPTGSPGPGIHRQARKLVLGDFNLTALNIAWGASVYGFYGCMQLGIIVLVAASFVDLNPSQAAIIAGAWGVSLTMGWISFLAPVGLGVRDGLAFALFTQVLDVPTASLIVVASRVTTLGVDLVFVGTVELLALGLSPSGRGFATACSESAKGPAAHTTTAAR